jgi:hypothetical protein
VALEDMNDSSSPDPARLHPARRDVLRLFGLTAAGVVVGVYAPPAMASFRPPAAFVGSSELSFVPEGMRRFACDGPASSLPALARFSVISTRFRGRVQIRLLPTTPTSGWVMTVDKPDLELKPGAQAFVSVTLDCYSHPQVGAEPTDLEVRVTATAYPADGSPPFPIGTLPALATCMPSRLELSVPTQPVLVSNGMPLTATAVVIGEHIDSAKFGPVKVSASMMSSAGTVAISAPVVSFQGSGSVPVELRMRLNPALNVGEVTVTVRAELDHPSFAAPMLAEQSFSVQLTP